MAPQPFWILIANSSKARLFEEKSPDQPWREMYAWVHMPSREHARELERDDLGRSIYGRTLLAPRVELHDRERKRFARELALWIQDQLSHGRMQTFAVVASNPFLGEFLSHFPERLQSHLVDWHPVDLTSYAAPEVKTRCSEFLNRPARDIYPEVL
ncbi:MAG: hypothetical protein RLZZ397_241 [Pseudomonadota bacterium]